MNKQEHINKMTEETLNSVDGAQRATAKPYLFTRLSARMGRQTESAWENAGRFIARPVVVVAGLCMIITTNALVIVFNNSNTTNNSTATEQQATPDEFSNTVATLYDIENNDPQ